MLNIVSITSKYSVKSNISFKDVAVEDEDIVMLRDNNLFGLVDFFDTFKKNKKVISFYERIKLNGEGYYLTFFLKNKNIKSIYKLHNDIKLGNDIDLLKIKEDIGIILHWSGLKNYGLKNIIDKIDCIEYTEPFGIGFIDEYYGLDKVDFKSYGKPLLLFNYAFNDINKLIFYELIEKQLNKSVVSMSKEEKKNLLKRGMFVHFSKGNEEIIKETYNFFNNNIEFVEKVKSSIVLFPKI